MSPRLNQSIAALALIFSPVLVPTAQAALVLTQAGIADGFQLSTFAVLDPTFTGHTKLGPLGVAYAGGGRIIVSNYANNTDNSIYSFADSNGQTIGSALNKVGGEGTGGVGMASAGGLAYGLDPDSGYFAQYNNDGTLNHDLTGLNDGQGDPISPNLGMAGNPVNGHVLATSSAGIIDIDPLANGGQGSFRVAVPLPSGDGDGVSVSPDGLTVYAVDETGGCVKAFTIATGAQVSNICGFTGHPDGLGVISGTKFNGDLVINNNNGTIILYDFLSQTMTTIAAEGTRGDYATADPTNGTLLLDFSDIIARLAITGGSIGSPHPGSGPGNGADAPEPASLLLLGLGLAGLGFARRKQADPIH